MRVGHREKGFTLLEVLVAFVVLALALSALMPPLSTMTERSNTSHAEWRAGEFAVSKLAAIGVTAPIRPGMTSGVWADALDWQIEIRTTGAAQQGAARFGTLYEIEITVRSVVDGRVLTRLSTLKHQAELP